MGEKDSNSTTADGHSPARRAPSPCRSTRPPPARHRPRPAPSSNPSAIGPGATAPPASQLRLAPGILPAVSLPGEEGSKQKGEIER